MIKLNKKTFDNGLRLVVLSGFSSNAATVTAYVRSGFRNDPVKLPGLAHFTEHMLFNGTKSYPDPKAVAYAVEQYGGWHDAFTWIEHQKHIVHVPKGRLNEGIDLLFETISEPTIRQKEIDKEKGVVIEEILLNKSDPYKVIWDSIFNPIFFQNTHLSRSYTGSVDDIEKIEKNDVTDFIDKYFIPENIVILIAGDVMGDQIVERIGVLNEKFLKRKASYASPLNLSLKKKSIFINDESYYQTSILAGVKTVSYSSEHKYAAEVLQSMMGGGYGSSITQKLRDSGGLTYGWRSVSDFIKEGGYSAFVTGCSHENVEKVSRVILDEYKRIGSGNFGLNEFNAAKSYLAGYILANIETGRDYIDWYGPQELLYSDKVVGPEEKVKILNQLTYEGVKEVAKNYFNEKNIFFGAIGKVGDKELDKLL